MSLLNNVLVVSLVAQLGVSAAYAELSGPPEGRQQLVDAIDAAWVRMVDEGEYREIVNKYDTADMVVNIVDCLPDPHVTVYPENPVGTLKRVLDEGKIRVGFSNTGTIDEGATVLYFTDMGKAMIDAVLRRIAEHYGVEGIEQERVPIPPPFMNTSYLDSGKVDMLGLVNALGGSTKDDKRRRKARRYTCTMTATKQFVWVLKDGGPDWQTVDDALNARDVHFCAGPASNELSKTYFDQPGQTTKTEFTSDLAMCLPKLVNGSADGMINPLPDERYFPKLIDVDGDGKPETETAGLFRAIDTFMVAGTPLWVAID
jgi:ABC-type amino acid transport substrate-binding protein